MKVEIWSDVMCPFCYIGKRKFEMALEQFNQKDKIEIIWKRFQLNPAMKTDAAKNINQYLAEIKGWSLEKAKEMNDYVSGIAQQVGLTYNLEKAIVANSFNAHRFSHLAKKHGLQNQAEETLFDAYFKNGKNTDDDETLIELGTSLGIDSTEIENTLSSNEFAEDVQKDIYEAQQIGVRGVPFFLFNNMYAISGAQEPATFLNALTQSWNEFEKFNSISRV